MGSANVREVAGGSFQIGMVAGYANLAQLLCLLYGKNAQRSTNLNVQLFLDALQSAADVFKVISLALAAAAGYDGEAYSASFLSLLCCIEDFLFAQQTIFLNAGMIMCGLSAELAVLAALAAAAIDDSAAVNLITSIFLANLVSHGQQHHGIVIAHIYQVFSFFFSNILAVQNLLSQSNNFLHYHSHP